MILINADDCGVFANKHIIVLSFVKSSPFFLRLVHVLAQIARKNQQMLN